MDTNPQESGHFLPHSDLLFRIRTKPTLRTSQTLKTSILALVDVKKTSWTPQFLGRYTVVKDIMGIPDYQRRAPAIFSVVPLFRNSASARAGPQLKKML